MTTVDTPLEAPAPVTHPETPPAVRRLAAAGLETTRRVASAGLDTINRYVLIAFGVQLIAMCWWSAVMYSRYSITHDGAEVLQNLYLTLHGHLVPYSTIGRLPGWQEHFTLAYWPFSIFDWVWPHTILVLWLQDAAMVVGQLVAFRWIMRVVTHERRAGLPDWWPQAMLILAAVVLIADPWTYWSISWDLHIETFAAPLILGAAYDFSQGRNRRAWIWVALCLLWGDVIATWVLGLALSALLAAFLSRGGGRHLIRTASLLGATGLGWLIFATLVGGNKGSVLAVSSGYVATGAGTKSSFAETLPRLFHAVVGRPSSALKVLAHHWPNILGVAGPAGWISVCTTWTIGVPFVIIFENNVSGFGDGIFSAPGFQSAPLFGFGAVGLVIILSWAAVHFTFTTRTLKWIIALFAANAVAWALVWIPQVPVAWLRVSAPQAAVLSRLERQIPQSDQLVVSQGVVGRFADRTLIYDLDGGTNTIPVTGHTVWFIITPNFGIEDQEVNSAQGAIGALADRLHAKLIVAKHGVWAFRWERPANVHQLVFPKLVPSIPAFMAPGRAGRTSFEGPPSQWSVRATGRRGYIVSSDYWQRSGGPFILHVNLSTETTVYVEVWDNNAKRLVARVEVPPTLKRATVFVPFSVPSPNPIGAYPGFGQFHIQPVPPIPGQALEIRVWTPGGALGSVYQLGLKHRYQNLSTSSGF
jgi:hypothetical protein